MLQKEIKAFIQTHYEAIFHCLNEHMPEDWKKDEIPKIYFPSGPKKIKEFLLRKWPEFEVTDYDIQSCWAFADIYKDFIGFNLYAMSQPFMTKQQIVQTICHELWHTFEDWWLPYPENNFYWKTKNFYMSQIRQHRVPENRVPTSLNARYNSEEVWAHIFDAAVAFDFFYGHEYIQKEFNIDTRKIHEFMKGLI